MPRTWCRWPQPKPETKRCAACRRDLPFTRDYWGPKKNVASGLSDGWCRKCITHHTKMRNLEERANALIHYSNGSPSCACCGECQYEFLTLDHINGGGNQHRLELTGSKKGGHVFYRKLREQGYPAGFRVLCFNCNMGRAVNGGKCPHAFSRRKVA